MLSAFPFGMVVACSERAAWNDGSKAIRSIQKGVYANELFNSIMWSSYFLILRFRAIARMVDKPMPSRSCLIARPAYCA